jgi:hypothetical protein
MSTRASPPPPAVSWHPPRLSTLTISRLDLQVRRYRCPYHREVREGEKFFHSLFLCAVAVFQAKLCQSGASSGACATRKRAACGRSLADAACCTPCQFQRLRFCRNILSLTCSTMLIRPAGSCRTRQGLLQVRLGARQAQGRARAWHHHRYRPVEVPYQQLQCHRHR